MAVETRLPTSRPAADRTRISAVDTARGLAVIGMIAAHTLDLTDLTWTDPGHWYAVVSGRSSILFAVLGGVSLALLTGRTRPPSGPDLIAARLRVIVRACLLFLLGGILTATAPSAAVILEYYAVMFVLAVPLLTWRPRRLLLAAAVWASVTPVLMWWLLGVLPESASATGGIVNLGITGVYPAAIWVAFVLVGLAIGRSDLGAESTRKLLLLGGSAAALLGYGCAWLATWLWNPDNASYLAGDESSLSSTSRPPNPGFTTLLNAEPHSGTTFEIVGSVGVAAAILGALLYLPPARHRILLPLNAIGSMPLTVYAAHIISLALWEPEDDPRFLLISIVIAALFALLWRRFVGRGPLEWVMYRVSAAALRHTRDTPTANGEGRAATAG
ncbi:heparan-alpha-glucosaminide N-acetyltransferase domain-containing protein [Nocardia arthritidis]|uniref:DUF1624 domain-containing protein n=1 Tax=Nocardia arthritidis TaxID=228602 RepID=A0A6G9YT57_9NOCA|nr:heparan-alpha-glucosaminide N-acetyltransferase domain-containing protein [Nocardia arthritidis]QIS16196.1 DUF1624 domain-containing protein [Nocardia arthritidis]